MPKKLEMTFTPNTIEHLGVRMYSTLPPVLAELVANAYDADATEVHIHLKDSGQKEIIVEDDGHGMSFDDINEKFLRIGRDRREEESSQKSPGGRKVIGKKGLGKLSFFGIAHRVEVSTQKAGKRNVFVLDWKKILSYHEKSKQQNYAPKIIEKDKKCHKNAKGTRVVLRSIQRDTDFDAENIADSLSKIFIVDPDFKIFIKHNDGQEIQIDNERRYASLEKEVEWTIPKDTEDAEGVEYFNEKGIEGNLIAAKTPIAPRTNMRGITLFSRKKLVNLPEHFSDSTSSHFFSYLTGWLEIDFIDDLDEDVIGTNRQSLNWDHSEMSNLREKLRGLLGWLERDWRKQRSEKRDKDLEKKTGLAIKEWKKQIPPSIKKDLDPILGALLKEAELSDEKTVSSLKGLQNIVKPYPYFHWRNLHPILRGLALPHYKNKDYYKAVFEGVKKYVREVQSKSSSSLTDRNLLENVFASSSPRLSVTDNFKKPDGTDFETDTTRNITEGHRMLVLAMWQAFRDPLSHELEKDLNDSGIYTEQDCLDALSLLSHLFFRLDNAAVIAAGTSST